MKNFLIGLLAIIVILAFDFIICAGLYKLICICFGLTFYWKYAVGAWIIYWLLSQLFKNVKGSDK